MSQAGEAVTRIVMDEMDRIKAGQSKDTRWIGLYKALIENGFLAEAPPKVERAPRLRLVHSSAA